MLSDLFLLLIFCSVCSQNLADGNAISDFINGLKGVGVSADPRPRSPSFKQDSGGRMHSSRSTRRLDPVTKSFKPVSKPPRRHSFGVGSSKWDIATKSSTKWKTERRSSFKSDSTSEQNKEALTEIVKGDDPCLKSEPNAETSCALATEAYQDLSSGKGCRLSNPPSPKCREVKGESQCTVSALLPRVKSFSMFWKGRVEKFYSLHDCAAELETKVQFEFH